MKISAATPRQGVYPNTNRQHDEYDDAYDADLAQGSSNPFESPTL